MDTRQLQMFLAVMDHGSLGQAAQHLGVSQPALTQSIRKLESKLKVKLFERSPRGMRATRYCEVFAERARKISLEMRLAIEDMEEMRGLSRGQLAVGAGPSLARAFLPEALSRLLRVRPRLRVTLIEGMSDTLFSSLARGDIDLAVTTPAGTEWEQQLSSELLFQDAVVVVGRSKHPLWSLGKPTLRDTLSYPWILPAPREIFRHRMEMMFARAKLSPPTAVIETTSYSAIIGLTSRTDYLSIVPYELIRQEEIAGTLAPIPVSGSRMNREVHAIYRQAQSLPPAPRALITHLHRVADELWSGRK